MKMKKKVVPAIWLLFAASQVFSQEPTGARPTAPPTVHITGQGCVRPGNVSGCLVVSDFKAHRKYNVFFLGNKPEPNTGISFEGLGYSKVDPHCKQGQKVQVSDWKPLEGECPTPAK
jgi:hypothetical protein